MPGFRFIPGAKETATDSSDVKGAKDPAYFRTPDLARSFLLITKEKTMIAQSAPGDGAGTATGNGAFSPGSDAEQDEVRHQLERILASPVFHNSKRYASVLRFIVEQTLQGFGDRLKERTIGIEVFDRP